MVSSSIEFNDKEFSEVDRTENIELGSLSYSLDRYERPLPEALSLNELLSFCWKENFISEYIFSTNTLFHCKIGMHKLILDEIYSARNLNFQTESYIRFENDFQNYRPAHQFILFPVVESDEKLNKMISSCLQKNSQAPTWLVSTISSVKINLLMGFHNFFLSTQDIDEITWFKKFLKISDNIEDHLKHGETYFFTDFFSVVDIANSTGKKEPTLGVLIHDFSDFSFI